ncbi:MAG: peptidyl-prolyl cis-trans isomerase [Planctomycetes bacterium]|nr:peptidyl-prolyl cis-trans isomerase [Planctomycetota bacterium]
MDPRHILFGLTASGFLAFGLGAEAAGSQPVEKSAVVASSEFGEPLIVNGKRVSDNEIKRALINGPCRMAVEMHRINLIIDDEIGRRARIAGDESVEMQVSPIAMKAALAAIEGQTYETPEARQKVYEDAYAKAYVETLNKPEFSKARSEAAAAERRRLEEVLKPTEAEFQTELKSKLDDFRKRYPVLDLEAEINRAFRSLEWYKRNLRQTLYFDHVFFPEDPADWPESTVESVRADSGQPLIDDAFNSYKMRREFADKTGEPLKKEDSIYSQMMLQIVRDALYNTIDFKTSFDGLPDDLVLTADKNHDGKPEMVLTTADMWNEVKDTVTKNEIELAKRWFIASIATADRLRADGALLDGAACNQALADLQKQFAGTYITLQIIATQNYFFPSVEAYKEYYCLEAGFKKMMAPKLAPGENGEMAQPLKDYLDRATRLMGLGQVDAECMLISAFDIPKFTWKPNGWTWAKNKAEEIKARIDAHTAQLAAQREEAAKAKAEGREFKADPSLTEPIVFWSELMNDHSEYWDPPTPEAQGGKAPGSDIGMKKRGRFGPRYRNDLQGYVGETAYTHWLTGESVTDRAFFDAKEGVVEGPFKGPMGYYLVRVSRRLPPTYPLNVSDPKKAELVYNDYLRVAFIEYTKEAVAKADVKGFTPTDS